VTDMIDSSRAMRAILIAGRGGAEKMHETIVPRPVAVHSEVLIRVSASSVNPVDVKTRAGGGYAAAITDYPVILGHDFCGEVVQAPYETHRLAVGTRVYGVTVPPRLQGTHAEYVPVPDLFVAPAPRSLSDAEAACVPLAFLTAWQCLTDVVQVKVGQKVFINAAAGGVGHFAVQIARMLGAVVTASCSERNVDFVRDLGAQRVVAYDVDDIEHAVRGQDVTIDLVGNREQNTGTRSLSTLRRGGTLVSVPASGWPSMVDDARALGVNATHFKFSPSGSMLAQAASLFDRGRIRVHVDAVLPLENAVEAYERVASRAGRGKTALTIGQPTSAPRERAAAAGVDGDG
jgi:NADPH:quinone reductase-like Zn-dependent oxidoreductase